MKKTAILRVLCAVAVSIVVGRGCPSQTSSPSLQTRQKAETLEQRIAQRDTSALIEAADANRKDLIPLIERFSDSKAGKKALAKLGVRKYLDEIVIELTNTSSAAVANGRGMNSSVDYARFSVQTEALNKLAYIKNRSTVKVIVALLYDQENADDYIEKSDSESDGYWYCMLIYERPSDMAMKTLAQIVDNPPTADLTGTNDTHDARLKIWQQWWQENKDDYP